MKEEWIKMESMNRSFNVFNTDGTKNGKVTRFALLELKINKHRENQCIGYGLKQHKYVLRIWLVSQAQFRSKLGQRDNMVYKMPKRVQNTVLGYYVHIKDQKTTTNGRHG